MLLLIAEVLGLTNAICQHKPMKNRNFGKLMSSSLMEDQFCSTLVPQELYTLMPAIYTGYGGYVVELGNEVVHGHWSVTETVPPGGS